MDKVLHPLMSHYIVMQSIGRRVELKGATPFLIESCIAELKKTKKKHSDELDNLLLF